MPDFPNNTAPGIGDRRGYEAPARPPVDTSEDAFLVRLAILRRMTLTQKAEQISELSEALRACMIAGVCFRHPEYAADEARWAVIRHLLGDELFGAAFPRAPRVAL